MKQLPKGGWISLCGLHKRTTEEELQAALADSGIDLDLDRISVISGDGYRNAYAVVSLSREHTRQLLERALMTPDGSPVKLHGRDLTPLIPNNVRSDW